MNTSTICPCDSGRPYIKCCGQYHLDATHHAPSASALMRSRYSAFVLGLNDYLLQTWHNKTRPTLLNIVDPDITWLGLQIKHNAMTDNSHATVEFVARSKRHGRASRLHETSRFVLQDGRWYYVDGDLH